MLIRFLFQFTWLSQKLDPILGGDPLNSNSQIIVCSPADRTENMDIFYESYVVSDAYIALIRSKQIDAFALSSLKTYMNPSPSSAPIQNSTIDTILGNDEEMSTGPQSIDQSDFISSDQVCSNMERILSKLDQISISKTDNDWYNHDITKSVNLDLYYINIDAEQKSVCPSRDCRVWRKIIEQIHINVSLGLVDRTWKSFDDFYANVVQNLDLLKMASRRAGASFRTHRRSSAFTSVPKGHRTSQSAPEADTLQQERQLAINRSVGSSIGCWCTTETCFSYFFDNFMMDTPKDIEQFSLLAHQDLDHIAFVIGVVTGTQTEARSSVLVRYGPSAKS